MPINTAAAIAATDVITASVASRMICRTRGFIHPPPPPNLPLEGGGTWLPPLQGEGWGGDGVVFGFGIAISLLRAPLPPGVEPDIFKVALYGWSEAIFSHAF